MAQIGQFDTNVLNYPELEEFSKNNPLNEVEAKVLPPSAFTPETIREILEGNDYGTPLPWKIQNGNHAGKYYPFRFRMKEVTVWAGANGVGKSMLTSQIALWLSAQGESCCLASFEMAPEKTVARQVRQMVGRNKNIDTLEKAIHSLNSRIWIYNKVGRANEEELRLLCHYVSSVHGVKHLFIDSLMMTVANEDDYNGQKRMIEAATRWCQEFNMHIHFVCHMRKGSREAHQGDMKDFIKGSSSITDLAFNVFTMRPNFEKLEERDMAVRSHDEEEDISLYVSKQRNGSGWTGSIRLWFNNEFLSFCDNRNLICPTPNPTKTPFDN